LVAIQREKLLLEEFLRALEAADIPVICVSATSGEGMAELCAAMTNQASVFSGQSGVGKSSLINAVAGIELPVGLVVAKTQKGSHTTTTANLLQLPFGGWCIDTPGIKSFGVWHLKKEEVEPFFSELHAVGQQCKYPNCTHIDEPDCAVMAALKEGGLSLLRYESYRFLLDSVTKTHLRR
jgi:ribosome biogenesis GTPase